MELIPLLTLKKHKIYPEPTANSITQNELLQQLKSDTYIYLLDTDGVNNNKPNLCLYQKLGPKTKLWTDSGPRVLGDVVDTVMTGAQRITIRPHLWTPHTTENILEITEQKIYILHENTDQNTSPLTADGTIFIDQSQHLQNNFKLESHLKNLTLKTPVYIYDPNPKNFPYWQKLGTTGILIDLIHYPEYLAHVH